jgi:uncharacterized protein YkwD
MLLTLLTSPSRPWPASRRVRGGVTTAIALWTISTASTASTAAWLAPAVAVSQELSEAVVMASGVADSTRCEGLLSEGESVLARLFEGDRRQRRTDMRCDPVLSRVARAKALDMGRRRYFDHVTPDRVGPNELVERAGYLLPDNYNRRRGANNIEAISAGYETAEQAWNGWTRSRSHRPLVLGLDQFFVQQTHYGVGYARASSSRYQHYWVLITARH